MTDPISRRSTLASIAALSVGPSAMLPAGRVDQSVAAGQGDPARSADMVSVLDFGAVPDGSTDNARAFERAIERAAALNRPILVPGAKNSYRIGRTVQPRTGIVGHGPDSRIEALSPQAFADGSPLVRIGWKERDSSTHCTVPVRNFRVIGGARRAARRTADPDSIGFAGTGILYDEMAAFIHAFDIGASFCRRGIDHGSDSGHLGGTAVQCSNNWYNLHWERNSGDYRYVDCILSGAMFASYGCHGTNKGFTAPGGITGLTLIGCHAGFSPFVFYQEDGDGTVGLVSLVSIASSSERVGNQVVRLGRTVAGRRRVSAGWTIIDAGHSWTAAGSGEHDAYAVQGDPHVPAQACAVELDLVQGPAIVMEGDGWVPGEGGVHTRIADLLAWVRDANGIGGYAVAGQGRERLIFTGSPALRMTSRTATAGPVGAFRSLGVFDVPSTYDNTPLGEVGWTLTYDWRGTAPIAVRLVALATGGGTAPQGEPAVQYLAPGRGNLSGTMRIGLGRRDRTRDLHRIEIRCLADGRGPGSALTLSGSLSLAVAQDAGIV